MKTLDISSSAIAAQRTRLDVIAGNIANAQVTRQENGDVIPYQRRFVRFMEGDGQGGPGVQIDGVHPDTRPFREKYDPGHPDANERGYVKLPNVNITLEYVDAMEATRAYEANVAMMNMSRRMLEQTVGLFG
jgi:flagellar basal-body rod protein FlgC